MPSQRRVRLTVVALILISVAVILMTSSARQADKRVRDRTLAGLDERRRAAAAAEAAAHAAEREKPRPMITTQPTATKLLAQDDHEAPPRTKHRAGDVPAKEPVAPAQPAKTKKKEGQPHEVEADKAKPGVRKPGERWGEKEEALKKEPEKTSAEREVEAELNAILKRSPIIIFSKTYCPYSKKAKAVFARYGITPAPYIVELDEHPLGPRLQDQLERSTGRRTVPNVLVNGVSVGGGDEVAAFDEKGELADKIRSLAGKRITEIKPVKE